MISNYILRQRISTLKDQKKKLVDEKLELSSTISDLGISKQAAYKQRNGLTTKVDPDQLKLRTVYAKRVLAVDKEIVTLNSDLKELFNLERSEENKSLMNIFHEIFTGEQITEIKKEAQRRMLGEPSFKLSFNVAESAEVKELMRKYKKQIIEQLDTMVKFRMELTNLIDKGCEQFGKAEFLTFISPLNRLIMPVAELEKIKRKIIG